MYVQIVLTSVAPLATVSCHMRRIVHRFGPCVSVCIGLLNILAALATVAGIIIMWLLLEVLQKLLRKEFFRQSFLRHWQCVVMSLHGCAATYPDLF